MGSREARAARATTAGRLRGEGTRPQRTAGANQAPPGRSGAGTRKSGVAIRHGLFPLATSPHRTGKCSINSSDLARGARSPRQASAALRQLPLRTHQRGLKKRQDGLDFGGGGGGTLGKTRDPTVVFWKGTKVDTMTKATIATFSAGMLFGLLIHGAPPVHAYERRLTPVAYCTGGNVASTPYSTGSSSGGGLRNSSNSQVLCGIPSDTDLRADGIATLNIHVYDGNNGNGGVDATLNVRARACRTYYTSEGGACGTETNTGAVASDDFFYGQSTLSPNTSEWAYYADFPYVWVSLSPSGTYGESKINGIYLSS